MTWELIWKGYSFKGTSNITSIPPVPVYYNEVIYNIEQILNKWSIIVQILNKWSIIVQILNKWSIIRAFSETIFDNQTSVLKPVSRWQMKVELHGLYEEITNYKKCCCIMVQETIGTVWLFQLNSALPER